MVRGTRAVFLFLLLLAGGCDRPAAPPAAAARPGKITVASLVPAATDLLIGMGARDALIAVSNYDAPRTETANLPRVGDYRTIDWEKLAELRPAVMVTQFRPDKMPAGLEDRAKAYGIRLVNIRIVRLDDVFASIAQLGDAVGEPGKAQASAGALRAELDAVRARVAGRPRVRTFVSRTDDPLEAVGGGNFVDDLLTIAGGQNVLAGPGYDDNSFPAVDRELLLSLKPDAVLHLLPGAPPQSLQKARAFWASVPTLPAVRAGRVHYVTDEYVLWPGQSVGKVAARFADALHGPAATQPVTPRAKAGERPISDTGFQPVRMALKDRGHWLPDLSKLRIASTGWKPVSLTGRSPCRAVAP